MHAQGSREQEDISGNTSRGSCVVFVSSPSGCVVDRSASEKYEHADVFENDDGSAMSSSSTLTGVRGIGVCP